MKDSLSNLDEGSDFEVEPIGIVTACPTEKQYPQDDEHSGEIRHYTGKFEGPEKTLEVCFRRSDGALDDRTIKTGLRTLSRTDLDTICAKARCTIISHISNQYVDAYLLSESSLFVYNFMLVLKTCGTTTLLRCLAVLIELGQSVGLSLDWVGYSRKNFNFPDDQCFPHSSFHQELDYLYSHQNLCEKLNGNGYTLGPITDDHWFVFVADKAIRSNIEDLDNDRVINIMMFDIDQEVADIFHYDSYKAKERDDETDKEAMKRISNAQTKAAGIDKLCPGAILDDRAFEPCGYSMNAILFKSYCTMHITPEKGSSYASFETNQKIDSYNSLISNVIRSFRPKRFVITLMADEHGLKEIKTNPLDESSKLSTIVVPVKSVNSKKSGNNLYKRTNLASIKVEDDCCCMMANWTLMEDQNDELVKGVQGRSRGLSIA